MVCDASVRPPIFSRSNPDPCSGDRPSPGPRWVWSGTCGCLSFKAEPGRWLRLRLGSLLPANGGSTPLALAPAQQQATPWAWACRQLGAFAKPRRTCRCRSRHSRPLGRALGNELLGCLEDCCRPGAGATWAGWRSATGPRRLSRGTRSRSSWPANLAQQLQLPLDGFQQLSAIAVPLVGRELNDER